MPHIHVELARKFSFRDQPDWRDAATTFWSPEARRTIEAADPARLQAAIEEVIEGWMDVLLKGGAFCYDSDEHPNLADHPLSVTFEWGDYPGVHYELTDDDALTEDGEDSDIFIQSVFWSITRQEDILWEALRRHPDCVEREPRAESDAPDRGCSPTSTPDVGDG